MQLFLVPTSDAHDGPSPLQVTRLFTGYVGAMLRDYAANPAGAWKSKDCAVYLVVALAVCRHTRATKFCPFLLHSAPD